MDFGIKRIGLVIAGLVLVLIVGFVVLNLFVLKPGKGNLSIINKSNMEISEGRIEVSDQVFAFYHLLPNEKVEFKYMTTHESHFHVIITFKSGNILTSDVGYVSRGLNIQDTIEVTNDSIILKDEKVEAP